MSRKYVKKVFFRRSDSDEKSRKCCALLFTVPVVLWRLPLLVVVTIAYNLLCNHKVVH